MALHSMPHPRPAHRGEHWAGARRLLARTIPFVLIASAPLAVASAAARPEPHWTTPSGHP